MKPVQNLTITQKAIANLPMPLVLAGACTVFVAILGMGWPRCLLIGVPQFLLLYGISWNRYEALMRRRRAEQAATGQEAGTSG